MVHILKIFVKSRCNTDVRRVAINSNILSSYNLLTEKIVSTFPSLSGKTFSLYWKDNDGDKISIVEDNDLAQAIANMDEILKIYVNVSGYDDLDRSVVYGSDEIHTGVQCDGCSSKVFGHRYKCLQCPDFDLCSDCNAAGKHPFHDMLKLAAPYNVPRQWAFYAWKRFFKSIFGCEPNVQLIDHSGIKNKLSGESCTEISDNFDKSGQYSIPSFNNPFIENIVHLLNDYPSGNFCNLINQVLKPFGADFRVEVDIPENQSKSKNEKASKKDSKNEPSTQEFEAEVKLENDKSNENTVLTTSNGARPKTIPKMCHGLFVHDNSEISNPENPNTELASIPSAPTLIEANKAKDLIDLANQECSGNAEGWTVINSPLPVNVTEQSESITKSGEQLNVYYPKLENEKEMSNKEEKLAEDTMDDFSTLDPEVANSLMKMRAMGFTNEGGWLLRLLQAKRGNIYQALDSLYPNQPQYH